MGLAGLNWNLQSQEKDTKNYPKQCFPVRRQKCQQKVSKKYLTVGLFLWQMFLELVPAFQLIPGGTHWEAFHVIPDGKSLWLRPWKASQVIPDVRSGVEVPCCRPPL